MKMDETEYTELYMELEKYEKRGIDMLLDGYQASPLQIVTAHMVKEAGTYMRDYTMSGDGNIETLRFTDINEHFRAEITPQCRTKWRLCEKRCLKSAERGKLLTTRVKSVI